MSEETGSGEEPKIIVDDDWKSQVEREKEELKDSGSEPESEGEAEEHALPPASFMVLMSTLATQAMAAMGLIPDPMTGQPSVNLPMAKHFIDLLGMLQEKTQGNLTEEEANHLRDGLHQLRMIFVSSEQASAGTDGEAAPKSSIELP
ncbi:DUF1844 domain-containing protein [bacterium]|jgi:hypothetical protein|nr:DUF1844 domain-containing protein [bacterium]